MSSRGGRVTLADVAREAGVSPATVSYVLNDAPNQKIPDATRQRVHDAVTKLGYTRSAAARTLSRGRSDAVLLEMPSLPIGPHLALLIEALTDDFGSQGLSLVTHLERPGRTMAQLWRELAPAAVVTFSNVDPEEHLAMRAAGIQVVSILPSRGSEKENQQAFVVSNERIGHLQAAHLSARGHRHIGYAAPTDTRVQHLVDMRLSGVHAACREFGLAAPVVQPVSLDVASTAPTVTAWTTADPPVTAVCAYNDEIAFALLAAMRTLGLTAPDDLAVIGVDNIPSAPFASPPLTTVDQDIRAMSAHVARMVAAGMAGRRSSPPPEDSIIKLVTRESA